MPSNYYARQRQIQGQDKSQVQDLKDLQWNCTYSYWYTREYMNLPSDETMWVNDVVERPESIIKPIIAVVKKFEPFQFSVVSMEVTFNQLSVVSE